MSYLKNQYVSDNDMEVSHNYLQDQFDDVEDIIGEIRKLVVRGDYTLGESVDIFEKEIADFTNGKYVVSTGSGTDAITLSLMSCGVGPGDEVITTPFTFFATIGAIISAGAKPVFCDIGADFNINPDLIKQKITKKTKAILPVHWAGEIANLSEIYKIGETHGLSIVEDACHAFGAYYNDIHPGAGKGAIAAFSLHPLKNLNCWGDGGFIVTDRKDVSDKVKLLRNHGLESREHCAIWGRNSRLDSLQAIVASWLLKKLPDINNARRSNAHFLDCGLINQSKVTLPKRKPEVSSSYHLYSFLADNRDQLAIFLRSAGIDAKIHYPVCMHLQPAAKEFGYKVGDFKFAEKVANETISLPIHEFVMKSDLENMLDKINEFYD